jgi:hypothetical protein
VSEFVFFLKRALRERDLIANGEPVPVEMSVGDFNTIIRGAGKAAYAALGSVKALHEFGMTYVGQRHYEYASLVWQGIGEGV